MVPFRLLRGAQSVMDPAVFQECCCNAFVSFSQLFVGLLATSAFLIAAQLPVLELEAYQPPRWRRVSKLFRVWLGVNPNSMCREAVLYLLFVACVDIAIILGMRTTTQ